MSELLNAIDAAKQTVADAPANAAAHMRLAALYLRVRLWPAAEASARLATLLQPELWPAWGVMGDAMCQQGRLVEAVAAHKMALGLAPPAKAATILCNYAGALKDLGYFELAMQLFEAMPAYSQQATGDGLRLFIANNHPTMTADEVFTLYQQWDRDHALPLLPIHPPKPQVHERLRIGYVSRDFYGHSVRYFLAPLLEHHDRDRFEIFAYSDVPVDDAWTTWYRGHFDQWRDIYGVSHDEVAQRIRDDEIDVLVDLGGHTEGNRLLVFARRPAPVQVSWLGFGYTTGLTAMDWFLGDENFTPPGCDSWFSERIWRLPRPPWVYRPPEDMPEVAPAPCLEVGKITFGCFSRTVRLNDQVLAAWAEILHRVPGARLVLNHTPFADPHTATEYRLRFARRGIAPDRLKLGYAPSRAAYGSIDIALDPFPHNGGATTFEALWLGVPVVSRRGRPSIGRFGDAVLTPLGHGDWVAESTDDYIDIAVALANDPARLSALRAELREQLRASALCDETGFARAIENAFLIMSLEKFHADHP